VTERPKGTWPSGISSHVGISEKHRTCGGAHLLCTSTEVGKKLKGKRTFHGRLFSALQSAIFRWKPTSAWHGY